MCLVPIGRGPHLNWSTLGDPWDRSPSWTTQREASLSLAPPTHCPAGETRHSGSLPRRPLGEASRCHTWDNELYISRASKQASLFQSKQHPTQRQAETHWETNPYRSNQRGRKYHWRCKATRGQGAVPSSHAYSEWPERGSLPGGRGVRSLNAASIVSLWAANKGWGAHSHACPPLSLSPLWFCLHPPTHLKKMEKKQYLIHLGNFKQLVVIF